MKDTSVKSLTIDDITLSYYDSGTTQQDMANSPPVFIWAHGWGQSHQAFLPLIGSFINEGRHIAIDFPGFGASPHPGHDWGTKDYADCMAVFIKTLIPPSSAPMIWIGHSFGGRVGIQLAAHYPDLTNKLILVAGAGLQRQRPPLQKIKAKTRLYIYKILKALIFSPALKDKIRQHFSSADYLNAGEMRGIFLNVIREDLSKQAEQIQCPTLLIYGRNDTETPPEYGERYKRLIPNSDLHILDHQDHYSVLSSGRYVVAKLIQGFIKK